MTDYEKLLEAADTVGDSLEAMQLSRRLAAALREVMDERDEALAWSDDESAQPEAAAIHAAHPTRTGKHETYAEAMRLVGARRSKGALVDLVNWLLVDRDKVIEDWAKSVAPSEVEEGCRIDANAQRDTALADVEAMRAVCDAARDADRAFADEDLPTLATTWSEARRRLLLLRHTLRALDARGRGRTR